MQYDFESRYDRTSDGSAKWQFMYDAKPEVDPSAIPFSVADMEFKTPPAIVDALKAWLEGHALGYQIPSKAYKDAIISWQKRRHSWDVKEEWLCLSAGIVGALHAACSIYTEPGDGVIIQPPVYYPFMSAVETTGRKRVDNPLIAVEEEDGAIRYEIDFDDLERKAADPANKLLILCSPHNPVGRVWTREELTRLAEICVANDVFIVSDEIHNDLILPGYEHTTIARVLDEKGLERVMVCTAPSKTFNIPGLQCSNIIIPGKEARDAYLAHQAAQGFFSLNAMAYPALIAAYGQCEEWLDQMLARVAANREILVKHLRETAPEVRIPELEGMFLQWLDLRAWGCSTEELESAMQKHDLFLDEGYIFGEEGRGFERINLACPEDCIRWLLPRFDAVRSEVYVGRNS